MLKLKGRECGEPREITGIRGYHRDG